jgi:hypothetical protein
VGGMESAAPGNIGEFKCGPSDPDGFSAMYGSCRGRIDPAECEERGLVWVWPSVGEVNLFDVRAPPTVNRQISPACAFLNSTYGSRFTPEPDPARIIGMMWAWRSRRRRRRGVVW